MSGVARDDLLPKCPRAVLRLGFAGLRELSDEAEQALNQSLDRVFAVIGRRLAAITPSVPVATGEKPPVAAFYANEPPLLRLVTGLCEGADSLAARALERVHITPDDPLPSTGSLPTCLETELAAVLPCNFVDYRASRPEWFRSDFDHQAERCSYILTLDGHCTKPEPDTVLARERRAKAYRAQSALLLRHTDLLVAAANPDEAGKAGGTMETARASLTFDLPLVFIHTGTGTVRLVDPGDDLASALAVPPLSESELTAALEDLVTRLVANPSQNAIPADGKGRDPEGLALLQTYFYDESVPSQRKGKRRSTWREWAWGRLEAMVSENSEVPKDPKLAPYDAYRDRATSLNYHYGGLYRVAFVLSYLFAVVAVLLATFSLVLLGTVESQGDHTGAGEHVQALAHAVERVLPTTAAGAAQHPDVGNESGVHTNGAGMPAWLLPALLVLGAFKLLIVTFIARNARSANRHRWSDLAVDYRYLAERQRALYYLPLAGSFSPPAAAAPQYASRAVHQSAVDWLFNAMVRSISPAHQARIKTLPTHDGSGEFSVRLLTLDPLKTIDLVHDHWIAGQIAYHIKNANTMGRLERGLERWGIFLSRTVVLVVAVDVAFIVADLAHLLPHQVSHAVHSAAPWLMFLAAVLPAAVAAVNGLRFQSECRRLAERSTMLKHMLDGRPADSSHPGSRSIPGRRHQAESVRQRVADARADPETDLGAWCLDALRVSENVAQDCVREVAEWSVLYAKELPET